MADSTKKAPRPRPRCWHSLRRRKVGCSRPIGDIGGVLTYPDGATENSQAGRAYTPAEYDAQLDRDLERHAAGIARCVPMERLTDGQKAAFVDIAFNIGVPAFCGSSMARRANAGDMAGACDVLLLWNRAGGRELAGLTKRRQSERKLCLESLQ